VESGGGGVEEEGADGVEVFGLAADVLADGLDVAEVAVEGGFAAVDGGGAEGVVHELDGGRLGGRIGRRWCGRARRGRAGTW
jgi:hypothetical protein